MNKRLRPGVTLRGLLVAIVAAIASLTVTAAPASASMADCRSTGYECTPGYYGSTASRTWSWKYYGAATAATSSGYHNCTMYAAYRLAENGMPDPGVSWGNAINWASRLPGDHTPSSGAIAWWGSSIGSYGHVAYVEEVVGSSVFITADNWSNTAGYTTSGWVAASSVPLFLHPYEGRDLIFAKTKSTGSGRVEIHTATVASGYQGSDLHSTTWLGTGDQSNGWFQMVGPDLYFIKTKNTGSGRVEIHSATAATGYQGSDLHSTTWFGTGDADNGWFQMVGRNVYFIKTRNTGAGRIEIHTATAASGYQASSLHTTTWFGTGDQSNGWFEMKGSDLYFIKTRNTGAGRIEIHTATAASGYQGSSLHTTTWFGTGDQSNGFFQMRGAGR